MTDIQDNYQLQKTINVQDVMIARITKNTRGAYETETPVYAAPTLSIQSQTKFNSADFCGDGKVLQTISSFAGGTLNIKLSDLTLGARAYMYGYEIDKNGVMVSRESQTNTSLAIGFRYKMSNEKFGFVWYYNVTFGQGENLNYDSIVDGKIKGEDIEVKGTFQARQKDGLYRTEATESEIIGLGLTTPESILSGWFTAPVEPDFASLKQMVFTTQTSAPQQSKAFVMPNSIQGQEQKTTPVHNEIIPGVE